MAFLCAGNRLQADAVPATFLLFTDTRVRFALDGIRAPWKIYCIRSAYYIYKSYGAALYREMLSVLVDAWGGDSDSFLSGILHGMARFLALYQGEYSRERLIGRLRTVHPKTITRLAQNGTGNMADRHMKQICNELLTWADVYDTANHDERRAILQQFIKEIRVRLQGSEPGTVCQSFLGIKNAASYKTMRQKRKSPR